VVVESCPVVSAAEVRKKISAAVVVSVVSAIDVDGTLLKDFMNRK